MLLILNSNILEAKEFEFNILDNKINMYISGYLCYKYIQPIPTSTKYDSIKSDPELGLLASIKLTERLNIFNQFKYGTDIDEILVYNQIDYTIDHNKLLKPINNNLNISDLEIKLKAGKIRYDNNLYGNTRVNPRTRQGVFQPQGIYWNTLAQNITSGVGVGTDIKYKDLTLAYVITNPTIINQSKESSAWSTFNFKEMSAKFGDMQVASLGYEIPKYGIKTKFAWSTLRMDAETQLSNGRVKAGQISLDMINAGIEYNLDDLTLSAETLITKPNNQLNLKWNEFDKLSKGFSVTAQYDINELVSVRTNYNEYYSTAKPPNPLQSYHNDFNIGLNYHQPNYMTNIEYHWMSGARIVDYDNFVADPNDYIHYGILAANIAYFFD